jgi:hypothetical protein
MLARYFGLAKQNGYVVRDLDAALEHWTGTLGVGPFYKRPHINLEFYEFNGVRSFPDISVALSYWGDLQIELIQQHNDAPSIYLEFLQTKGPGLHHVLASDGRPLDDTIEHLARLGRRPTSIGGNSGGRFVYFDLGGHSGSVVELVDIGPETLAWFEQIRRSAATWDGSEPVRLVK